MRGGDAGAMTSIPNEGDFAVYLDRRRHQIWFWSAVAFAFLFLAVAVADPFGFVGSVAMAVMAGVFAGRAFDPRPGLVLTDDGIVFPQMGVRVAWREVQSVNPETVQISRQRPLLPMPYSNEEQVIRFDLSRAVPPDPDCVARFAAASFLIRMLRPPRTMPKTYALPQPLATVTSEDLMAAVERRRAAHPAEPAQAGRTGREPTQMTENPDGSVMVGDRTFGTRADAQAFLALAARHRGED